MTIAACAWLIQGGVAEAAFPGTNGSIVFQSNRDTAAGDVYAVRPGSAVERISTSSGSSDPVVSPDGARIAYVSASGSGYQVFVMNADGGDPHPVTATPTAKQQPTWSPDGRRIAFVANSFDVDGQTDLEIWSIDVDGTGLQQLTSNTFEDKAPAWSPDGSRIAFVGTRPGDTDRNIYVMNADGSGATNITPPSSTPCSPCYQGNDEDPAWSPDGSRIAYTHSRLMNASGPPNIWTMDPNGANKVNLSPTDVSLSQPAWSPQGDKLAMVGAVDTNRDIWVMNADGSGPAPVETSPAHDTDPDWGPADTKAPELDVAAKKSQRLGASVKVKVRSDEACTARGTGVLVIAKGRKARGTAKLKLKKASGDIAAGGSATLKLTVPKRTRKVAERALDEGQRVSAKLKLSASDTAGNRDTGKATVRIKR